MPLRHVNLVNCPRPLDIYELFNGLSDTAREKERERERDMRTILLHSAGDLTIERVTVVAVGFVAV